MQASTRTKQEGHPDGQLGVHVDFFTSVFFKSRIVALPDVARDRFFTVRVGCLFGKTPASSADPFTEHTGLVELTPRFFLHKRLLLTDRNRDDLRFLNGDFLPAIAICSGWNALTN